MRSRLTGYGRLLSEALKGWRKDLEKMSVAQVCKCLSAAFAMHKQVSFETYTHLRCAFARACARAWTRPCTADVGRAHAWLHDGVFTCAGNRATVCHVLHAGCARAQGDYDCEHRIIRCTMLCVRDVRLIRVRGCDCAGRVEEIGLHFVDSLLAPPSATAAGSAAGPSVCARACYRRCP